MKQQFLPDVRVTTIIWADEDRGEVSPWFAAQGDDLKNQIPAIEINLPRIIKKIGEKPKEVALEMIKSWLSIYIIFATRQELINKQVRGWLSPEAEKEVENANFKAIISSPILWSLYCEKAVNHIKESQAYKTEAYRQLLDDCLKVMDEIMVEARPFIGLSSV